jgi:hypothetical protein
MVLPYHQWASSGRAFSRVRTGGTQPALLSFLPAKTSFALYFLVEAMKIVSMRLALFGPAAPEKSGADLQKAAEFALFAMTTERAVYLGDDDAMDLVAKTWNQKLSSPGYANFWEEVRVLLDPKTDRSQVEQAALREQARLSLRRLEVLPRNNRRSLELLGSRVAVLVDDRERLEAEDLAEANLVIYGKSPAPRARLVGEQWFISPGSLSDEGGVAIIEETGDTLRVTFYDCAGNTHGSEILKNKAKTKFMVQGGSSS